MIKQEQSGSSPTILDSQPTTTTTTTSSPSPLVRSKPLPKPYTNPNAQAYNVEEEEDDEHEDEDGNVGCSSSSSSSSKTNKKQGTKRNADDVQRNDEKSAEQPEKKKRKKTREFLTMDQPLVPRPETPAGAVIVYTDGSCKDNGKEYARAGAGVFFGFNHPQLSVLFCVFFCIHLFLVNDFYYFFYSLLLKNRNLSRPVIRHKLTNNIAELYAIQLVLETVPLSTPIEIRTDSKLCKDWLERWLPFTKRYCKNNPSQLEDEIIRAGLKLPGNVGLLQHVIGLLLKKEQAHPDAIVVLTKVKGHSDVYGNLWADYLATSASDRQTKKVIKKQ